MLRGLVDRLFARLGYVVMRESHFLERRGTLGWERLGMLDIRPQTVVDVGVAYGTPELYQAFPDAELVLVEPLTEYDAAIAEILARRRGRRFTAALGSADGTLDINVEPDNRLKSSFKERTAESSTGATLLRRTVPVRRLDSLLDGEVLSEPMLLKVDVEGFELEALRGAPRTLARTTAVIVETSIARRFSDGPGLTEIVAEMQRNGFEVFDFLHVARGTGPGARHADLLFLRTDRLISSGS